MPNLSVGKISGYSRNGSFYFSKCSMLPFQIKHCTFDNPNKRSKFKTWRATWRLTTWHSRQLSRVNRDQGRRPLLPHNSDSTTQCVIELQRIPDNASTDKVPANLNTHVTRYLLCDNILVQSNFQRYYFLHFARSSSNSPRSFQRFRRTLVPNFI